MQGHTLQSGEGAARHCATGYADRLLIELGHAPLPPTRAAVHPAVRWAQCGAMSLTGYPQQPPQVCPVPLASYSDGVVAALNSIAGGPSLRNLDGARLLGERACLANLRRAGMVSVGGGCRFLAAADGWFAVNLTRAYDWEVLPAWLETDVEANWNGVAEAVKHRTVDDCVARGRLLGLAVAAMNGRATRQVRWYRECLRGDRRRRPLSRAPLVVDLSALWAGPLCTHILQALGARVIKVESTSRPDGMRQGLGGFYDLLNAGKSSVALDFSRPDGRAQLRQLLLRADIVVEASRQRALSQLGIRAGEILGENPGATWMSICGYGREEPEADWIAYGDDAAIAAGLSQVLWDCTATPMFCGDAIADPLAGMHAALAAWSSYLGGGGRLLCVALCDVVAHCIEFAALGDRDAMRARLAQWSACISAADVAVPGARPDHGKARPLGADTHAVLSGLGIRC